MTACLFPFQAALAGVCSWRRPGASRPSRVRPEPVSKACRPAPPRPYLRERQSPRRIWTARMFRVRDAGFRFRQPPPAPAGHKALNALPGRYRSSGNRDTMAERSYLKCIRPNMAGKQKYTVRVSLASLPRTVYSVRESSVICGINWRRFPKRLIRFGPVPAP